MKNIINIRVCTPEGWRSRTVPTDIHKKALLRVAAMQSGAWCLQPVSTVDCGPWSRFTKKEREDYNYTEIV
jgi:hypothetical protein